RSYSSEIAVIEDGRSAAVSAAGTTALAPVQEGQPLEQVDVLLVLQQGAVQGRDQLARRLFAQGLRRDVIDQQQLQPVQQFRGRGLLLQARRVADFIEGLKGLGDQPRLDAGEVDLDDVLHGLCVGEADVVEEAAAQEGVRQLLFIVRGDDDDGADLGADRLVDLLNVELHAVEFLQQVVGEFDVGLVDFVDQQDGAGGGGEGLPQLALFQIVAHVVDPRVAQLAVAQAADGIVFIEAVVGLGRRLDVPGYQRRIQRAGQFIGQDRLARAGLALDQQRPFKRYGGVDRDLQVFGGDVVGRAFETAYAKPAPFRGKGAGSLKRWA